MDEPVPVNRNHARRSFFMSKRFCFSLVVFVVFAIAGVVTFGGDMSIYSTQLKFTNAEQAETILTKVGKLIKLPEGETPTVATIEDAETLKVSQPFLASADNGDVLIIYTEATMALLYRPSDNILVAVGPVTGEVSAHSQMTQVKSFGKEVETETIVTTTLE